MPVPSSADEFLAIVRKSGVVAAGDLDDFAVARTAEQSPPDATCLARDMVRKGLITGLQAANLLRGKW